MDSKILHITNDYYNSEVYKQLHHELLKAGVNSIVFTPVMYSSDVYNDDHVECVRCFSKFDRFFFNHKQRKIYAELSQSIQHENPSLIHAHFVFSAGYLAYKAKKEYGIPYIVTVRNTDINTFFRYCFWLRKTGIEILKNAEKVIVLSKAYQKIILDKYVPSSMRQQIENKTQCIPNGVSQYWIDNRNSPKVSPHKPLRLVFAGTINKNKNIVTIAKTCNTLINEGIETVLTVVGSVKSKKIYRILKYHYPRTVFIQKQQQEALRDIYRDNDIFVMPSFSETFGLVYVEAMSQGLPVIYTENQGFDKQFAEGVVGYHVNPKKPSEIAEKIKSVVEAYKGMSKNCVTMSEKFNWKMIAERYIALYENVLKRD